MSNVKSVSDVIKEITPEKKGAVNRFSKKSFHELMKAMANDVDYKETVAKVKSGELKGKEDIPVTEGFRKFLRKNMEKAGMDKADSAIVMDKSFTIDSFDGMYDFVEAALYNYMAAGNNFEFQPREDFRGKMTIVTKPETVKVREVRNPQTKETMGPFEFTTTSHKILKASSPAPKYLTTR